MSLAAANISSAVSSDKGDHFALSPAVADVPADDRQWIEAQGDAVVYQMYRAPIPATGLWVQRSTDHGVNWGTASLVSPTGTSPGYIDVDHASGVIYVTHTSSSALFVSRSADNGTTWTTATVDNSTSHGNLFDPVKVGDDGTVYVSWSDEHNVFLAHSTDQGQHWSPPVQVNGAESQVALFPWLEAGSAGRVAVVWYGTDHTSNDNAADWRVYSAITLNATATNPLFHRAEVSDHVVHSGNISLGGLGVDTPVTPQQRALSIRMSAFAALSQSLLPNLANGGARLTINGQVLFDTLTSEKNPVSRKKKDLKAGAAVEFVLDFVPRKESARCKPVWRGDGTDPVKRRCP